MTSLLLVAMPGAPSSFLFNMFVRFHLRNLPKRTGHSCAHPPVGAGQRQHEVDGTKGVFLCLFVWPEMPKSLECLESGCQLKRLKGLVEQFMSKSL